MRHTLSVQSDILEAKRMTKIAVLDDYHGRALDYADWQAVLLDLDAIVASLDAGTLRTSGNWTPG